MQNAWVGHLSCLEFIQELCRNREEHEVIIALDGLSAATVEHIRSAFDEILPQENIRLWFSPVISSHSLPHSLWLPKVADMLERGFLSSLYPDMVLVMEPFKTSAPANFSSSLRCCILLSDPSSVTLSGVNEIDNTFFLAPSEQSRKTLIDQLGIEEQHIVAIAQHDNDPLDQQAQRTLRAFEKWNALSTESLILQQKSERRPKLAYISPLPPERSGISDYSAELLPELLRHYEIDVVVDHNEITSDWVKENCPIRTAEWFMKHAESYDRVLYHMGNSPFHLHMFDLLNKVPGVVVLHDFFLSDILEYRSHLNLTEEVFIAELYRSHGYPALRQLFAPETKPGDIIAKYPCNFDVLERATGVILHSEYSRALCEEWYGGIDRNCCTVIPLLRSPAPTFNRSEARRTLELKEDDLVVCSFGMPGIHKLSNLLLDAWLESSLAVNEHCVLIFIGEVPGSEYCRKMQAIIEQNNDGKRIRMTGWVSMEKYRLYLASADIGIQLRTMSRGESSASALDCMNYGLATVVNANGSLRELPEKCVLMLHDEVTMEELQGALETLHSDASLRKQLGENARAYVLSHRTPSRIADLYAAAIERFSFSPASIRHSILHELSHNHDLPDDETDRFAIAEAIAETFPDQCGQKQLLIDISALVVEDLKTGIQRVVRSIVKELLEEPPQGFRIEPVFMEQGERGVFYSYARQFTLNLLGIDSNPCSLLKDNPVDVHAGDIFLGLDLCHNVRHGHKFFEKFRRDGGLVYFVVYDLLPLSFPNFFPPTVEKHHSEWMEIVAQCDGALCISRSVADDVKAWFDSVQPQRHRKFSIGWFHLGADIEKSIPTKGLPEDFHTDLQKLASAPTIVMVGTVEPRKGHGQVLKAFELLWMTCIEVNLVIAGKKGWMVEKLAAYIGEHKKLNQQLFWYENISDEALQKLYTIADGVIMASEGEGFGLPLIEAAQQGCPVLARDLPVFREVAGEHASYFNGKSSLKLASVLIKWIADIRKGAVILSGGMPWMTWKESSTQVMNLLTDSQNNNWLYQWEKSSRTLPPHQADFLREPVSPKNIAVDLTPVLPGGENGGAKVFVLELLRMLARMKPDTQFILLTRESSHKELSFLDRQNMKRVMVLAEERIRNPSAKPVERLTLWTERTLWGWKRSALKRLKVFRPASDSLLHDMGVDLLFCPFTSLHNAEHGIPAVCTIYDLQYKTYPEFFTPDDLSHRDRVFVDACRRAAAITTISEYSRKSAIAHGNIDPSIIRTIYLRMSQRIQSNTLPTDKLLNRLGLKKQKYLLYTANFWKHKNHETLLTAFGLACNDSLDSEMKLVCTGAPSERQQLLLKKTRYMKLESRVIFPGYLPNDELALLLSNSAGTIFPSLYEGFGLPVLEAMAAGVPVACSNTRSLPEVVANAALLFDPTSPEQIAWAMLFLAGKDQLRLQLIQDGLQRAAEFSDQERMAREYWELFEDAMTANNTRKLQENVWDVWLKNNKHCTTKASLLTVSIVTPSLNQGQFIERTLMSVANQNWPGIEHVVFDGGSTDNTIDILQKFSLPIKWVSEKDKGQSDAINKGIRTTEGDIIGWLNSDDIYYPDTIARIVTFFTEHPEIDLVYGQADHIDVNDRPFESYPTEPWNSERFNEVCFICQPAVFFRRQVVEQHGLLDESLHYCMDYEYWHRLAGAGVRFAYLEEKLAGSRLYADNKTLGSKVKVHREINDMFQRRLGAVPKRWLQNYAHITMHERLEGHMTSRMEFNFRYFIAKLRWKKL